MNVFIVSWFYTERGRSFACFLAMSVSLGLSIKIPSLFFFIHTAHNTNVSGFSSAAHVDHAIENIGLALLKLKNERRKKIWQSEFNAVKRRTRAADKFKRDLCPREKIQSIIEAFNVVPLLYLCLWGGKKKNLLNWSLLCKAGQNLDKKYNWIAFNMLAYLIVRGSTCSMWMQSAKKIAKNQS